MIERIIQIERGTMKITAIAARLHKIALDMEALAAREGDYDFPDEMVLPLIVNAFRRQRA
jgi:hypothetical protein